MLVILFHESGCCLLCSDCIIVVAKLWNAAHGMETIVFRCVLCVCLDNRVFKNLNTYNFIQRIEQGLIELDISAIENYAIMYVVGVWGVVILVSSVMCVVVDIILWVVYVFPQCRVLVAGLQF